MASKKPTDETIADKVIAPEYMAMTEEAMAELRKQTSAMVTDVRRDIRDYAWKKVHEEGEMISAASSEGDETPSEEEKQEKPASSRAKKKKGNPAGGE